MAIDLFKHGRELLRMLEMRTRSSIRDEENIKSLQGIFLHLAVQINQVISVTMTSVVLVLVLDHESANVSVQLVGDVDSTTSLVHWACQLVDDQQDRKFESTSEARDALMIVEAVYMSRQCSTDHEEISAIAASLQLWTRDFESFRQSQSHEQAKPYVLRELAVLELQMLHLDINLAIAQSPDPKSVLAWDMHLDKCGKIVDLAATALAINAPDASDRASHQPQFSFGIGVIPTLFYVAVMCRDPLIRRKAIRLMAGVGVQDGVWNSVLTAKVAERYVEIEEADIYNVSSCGDVPEEARITACVVFIDDDDTRATVQYARGTECWHDKITWKEMHIS